MWQRLSALPLLAFFVLIEPLQAIAQQTQDSPPSRQWYGSGPWHMWGGDGYGWPFWWGGPFVMMLFWVLVFGAIVYLVARRPHMHGGHWGAGMDRPWGDPTYSALQILSERFARGEIQKNEYEEKKAAILSGMRR
jgi:putative membrane protein